MDWKSSDMFANEVERQQGMAQMIKDPHEDHEVEPLPQGGEIVDRQFSELDVGAVDLGRQPGLGQVPVVEIDPKNPFCAAALHLQRVETGVAADIEDAPAAQILRKRVSEAREFRTRIVLQKMMGRSLDAAEIQVVKPFPEILDPGSDFFDRQGAHCGISFKLNNLYPHEEPAMQVTEPGLISRRSWDRGLRPSATMTAALMTSAWLTAATALAPETTPPSIHRSTRAWTSIIDSPPSQQAWSRPAFQRTKAGRSSSSVMRLPFHWPKSISLIASATWRGAPQAWAIGPAVSRVRSIGLV